MNRRTFLPLIFSVPLLFFQSGCEEQALRLEDIVDKKVARVEHVGKKEKDDPNIILFPIIHAPKSEARVIEPREIIEIARKLKDISFKIYDSGLADTLLLEGLVPEEAEKLRKFRKMTRKGTGLTKSPSYDEYTELIIGRDWNLPGIETERENHQSKIRLIGTKYELKVFLEMKNWKRNGLFKSKEAFEAEKENSLRSLNKLVNEYMEEVRDYFENQDPKGEKLFHNVIEKRNKGMWQAARAELVNGAKGTLSVFGAVHEQGIREQITNEGLPYSIVRLKEVPKYKKTPREEILRWVRQNAITLDNEFVLTLDDETKQEFRLPVREHEYYKRYVLSQK